MRHQVAGRKLNRTTSHRLAMLNNMVTSLLEHEAIRTTVPKAKEARKMAERIITLGKKGGLANVRLAARVVKDKDVLHKVFTEYKERYAQRPGGYTRIVRIGFRRGDAAEMALLELVDRPAKPAKQAEPAKQQAEGGEQPAEAKQE
jgi:large subunit ribosomal protein L17